MSGPFRSPANDPFQGGARFGITPPTGSSGTPGLLGGGVQPPLAVSAPTVNMARNNRGTNVQIPHARIVPLSPADTALPDIGDLNGIAAGRAHVTGGSDGMSQIAMLESEALAAGRIGFVLGCRKTTPNDSSITLPGFKPYLMNGVGVQRGLGSGYARVDRMCSLEYLTRYFGIVLRRLGVTLSTVLLNDAENTSGLLRQFSNLTTGGKTAISGPDVVAINSHPPSAPPVVETPMGVCAFDVHPFIRGKSLENALTPCLKPTKTSRHSRAMGDMLCISALEAALGRAGLFDWRPDGIVVGKESSGQESAEIDAAFDARLQQLFNVAVQGPAVTTSCVGNRNLVVLPGDRVFVTIVCDRLGEGIPAGGSADVQKYNDHLQLQAPSDAHLEDFEKLRKKMLDTPASWVDATARLTQSFKTAGKDTHLCNFRLRLATSSEMINRSGVVHPPGTPGNVKIGGPHNERMDLRFGNELAEYILGGWCIGRVMDSAASRAALPGQFASNRDPTTYAINLDVGVEWWSGDRLFRTFCDREGTTFLGRHESFKPKPNDGKIRSQFAPSPDKYYMLEGSRRASQRP